MNKYYKIIDQVREKGNSDKKIKEKEVDAIVEVMCLSIEKSPHMIALDDGAATLAALYTLCLDDGINTIGVYLEIRKRLNSLMDDMYNRMREIYPVPAKTESDGKLEPKIKEMIEQMRAISTNEWRDHHDLDG